MTEMTINERLKAIRKDVNILEAIGHSAMINNIKRVQQHLTAIQSTIDAAEKDAGGLAKGIEHLINKYDPPSLKLAVSIPFSRDLIALITAALLKAGQQGWQDISSAPKDGSEVLLYRPLAQRTNDPVVTIKRCTPYTNHCWEITVPEGSKNENFNEGSCFATHWQPLPAPPSSQGGE